jgi:hypothetical protein
MELYSGQGKLRAAKLDAKGNMGDVRFVGNVPRFTVSFLTGEIEFYVQRLDEVNLEVICGSTLRPSTTNEFTSLADDDLRAQYPNHNVLAFDIGESAPFEYALFFDGIDTATSDAKGVGWGRLVRLELHRVITRAGQNFDLISDEFASVKITAEARCDERHQGKRGKFFVIERFDKGPRQESVTGLRLKGERAKDAIK